MLARARVEQVDPRSDPRVLCLHLEVDRERARAHHGERWGACLRDLVRGRRRRRGLPERRVGQRQRHRREHLPLAGEVEPQREEREQDEEPRPDHEHLLDGQAVRLRRRDPLGPWRSALEREGLPDLGTRDVLPVRPIPLVLARLFAEQEGRVDRVERLRAVADPHLPVELAGDEAHLRVADRERAVAAPLERVPARARLLDRGRADVAADVRERRVSINLRLAAAEQIEVGSVEDDDAAFGTHAKLPDKPTLYRCQEPRAGSIHPAR